MRKLYFCFALGIASACAASAQPLVSIGAIGGVRLTDVFYQDESRRFVVGGSVEVRLPARFAIEADALYQRVGDTASLSEIGGPAQSFFIIRERANAWQFPLYVKYYFRPNNAAWQPFVGTGFAFRTASFHNDTSAFNVPSRFDENGHFDLRSDLGVGASIIAGIRLHYGRVAFLPQARYTRWGDNSGLNKNEATLLLGVTF